MQQQAILDHNVPGAAVWNSGGRSYDRVSETIADSIEHCVLRLDPSDYLLVLGIRR